MDKTLVPNDMWLLILIAVVLFSILLYKQFLKKIENKQLIEINSQFIAEVHIARWSKIFQCAGKSKQFEGTETGEDLAAIGLALPYFYASYPEYPNTVIKIETIKSAIAIANRHGVVISEDISQKCFVSNENELQKLSDNRLNSLSPLKLSYVLMIDLGIKLLSNNLD